MSLWYLLQVRLQPLQALTVFVGETSWPWSYESFLLWRGDAMPPGPLPGPNVGEAADLGHLVHGGE